MIRILLTTFFVLAGATAPEAKAQDALTLTLRDAVAAAQARSPASTMARLRFEEARWSNRAFEARYLPSLMLSGDAPGLLRSISDVVQDDGSVRYVPQRRTFSTVQLSVQQPLPATGGSLFLSSGLSRIGLFGDIGRNEWQSAPLLIGLSQPLFQFNAMRWERRQQPLRYRVAQQALSEELADVAVDVANLFFQVFIARKDVERAADNVAVNDTIYTLSEGRYDLGRIAENDLLQSELALLNARTEHSEALIGYERALQDLKTALGIRYDASLHIIAPLDVPETKVDPAVAVAQARRNRAILTELDLNVLLAERAVDQARNASGFSATLNASYGLNQHAETLTDLYQSPLNQQRFSLGFQLPVFQWGRRRAEFEAAVADRDRVETAATLQRQEIEQEVYFEALQFLQLQEQVRLAAKADTIAARRFEVARNRYTIGKIDITDLFEAQRAKDSSSQAFFRTLHQYWVSYYRLRRLTLYDFDLGRGLE